MNKTWKLVDDKCRIGVVLSNFNQTTLQTPYLLQFYVGDIVHIYKELDDWYYGCLCNKQDKFGIFPKSYVGLKESFIDKSSGKELIKSTDIAIAQEIILVLKEWCPLWKNLYILREKNFDIIKYIVYELINLRSKILSGTLPLDEIRELKQKATLLIDCGNHILKLDLSVRDDQGNIINSFEICAIDLFKLHENLYKKNNESVKSISSRNSKSNKSTTNFSVFSHNLCVVVKNFACPIYEDVQLLMGLYDSKEMRFISENFFVKWNKNFLMDLDLLNNLKVLFCDLGSKDLEREKMFFVCQIIRIGNMENKEIDQHKLKHNTLYNQKKFVDDLRRPFGVAALEISDFLIGKKDCDFENDIYVPIFQFTNEKDSLDSLIKKITNSKICEIKDHKGQGLWISLKMLHGELKQVRDEYPHLVSPLTSIAKKMGFPEVILPEDIRNDLYLTLVSGDFSSRSSNAKNIEISVKICNEKGEVLNNVITYGAGSEMMNEYKSVIYYHEEKPRWMETFKISIPVEDFYNLHIKFTFKHRSSIESKDKNEKPFAIAFIKLMNENGTTIKDGIHSLLIYKIDAKKVDELETAFKHLTKMLSTKFEYEKLLQSKTSSTSSLSNQNGKLNTFPPLNCGLSLNLKDSLLIETVICSTKLTQNIDLLGLLKWSSKKDASDEELKFCLTALMKVDGEEIVKFLQDTLDSLFNILMERDVKEFNYLVFEALVFIIGLISDRKYQHFRPILDVYIQENFSATLAYNKLIFVLINFIESVTDGKNILNNQQSFSNHEFHSNLFCNSQESFNLRAMKCLEFIFKFIVRSRYLFASLNGGAKEQEFEESMTSLFNSLIRLLSSSSNASIIVQGSCLKYLPYAIPDILTVFNAKKLSLILINLINSVPIDKLRTQKMVCILDILNCQNLFNDIECRNIFLPVFNNHIRLLMKTTDNKSFSTSNLEKVFSTCSDGESRLKQHEEELNICIQVLSEMLFLLSKQNKLSIYNDINNLINTLLPTLIQTIIDTDRNDAKLGGLVSIMIEVFRQMTSAHFDMFINNLLSIQTSDKNALILFLMRLLMVFEDLSIHPVFKNEWTEMTMLQNSVILNTLRLIFEKLKFISTVVFENEIYNNFFHCAIAFLTQKSLQLENFSLNKRKKLITKYKDMRKETALLIRCLWFQLEEKKAYFIPNMIGPFLEMSLIPDVNIRKIGLTIFFDMMEFEYTHKVINQQNNEVSNRIKKFTSCEQELINQLDKLVEGGKGDEEFKDLFLNYLGFLCQGSLLGEQGLNFVKTAVCLMKRLLEYRNVINCSSASENIEQVSLCLMRILEFYHDQKQQEMYIRYLYKLCNLHLKCDNFSGAAYVMKLHTDLLEWTDEPLTDALKCKNYSYLETHRELKEKLYLDIIDYFDKGKLWEEGLRICKELAYQYENETFNFIKLAELHQRIAQFYDNIMKQIRHKPEYFRISFYGKGFSNLLQKKSFIYRAKPYEKLFDFRTNLLNQFPNAELLDSLNTPGPEITESNNQYILINQVEPCMNDRAKESFKNKQVSPQIQQYYEANEVQKFNFSRIKKPQNLGLDSNEENEFANMWIERTYLKTSYPLPGILNWFPVLTTSSYSLSPIENAIETMETANAKIKKIILEYISDYSLQINSLTMLLNGIVDAAVNGGISNYEKVFFTEEYSQKHSTVKEKEKITKLKNLIAAQIPLLDMGIQLHKERAPRSLLPLHEHLTNLFNNMKNSVESKYGKSTLPKELIQFNLVKIRKNEVNNRVFNRFSGESFINSKINTIQSQYNLDFHKHNSMISLNTNSKNSRSKSVFIRSTSSNNQYSTGNLTLNSNTFQSLINSGTSTITSTIFRKHKDHFNSRKLNTEANTSSQWYDEDSDETKNSNKSISTINLSNNGIIELRESLTAQRPLRSDMFDLKRNRNSGTNSLNQNRSSISNGNSSTSLSPQCSEIDSKSFDENNLNLILYQNSFNTINSKNIISPSNSFSLPNPTDTNSPSSDLDNQPPPLPVKNFSVTSETILKQIECNGQSPLKNSNSFSHTLKKKLPLPNPSLNQKNNYNSIPSPTCSPNKNYHLKQQNHTNSSEHLNYELIPPLPKKLFRPVPPLPTESEPSSFNKNGETEV